MRATAALLRNAAGTASRFRFWQPFSALFGPIQIDDYLMNVRSIGVPGDLQAGSVASRTRAEGE